MVQPSKTKLPRRIQSPMPGMASWLDELWRAVESLSRWRDSMTGGKTNRPYLKVKVCVEDEDGNAVERDAYVMGYLLPESEE
jgi:hypothetical protein